MSLFLSFFFLFGVNKFVLIYSIYIHSHTQSQAIDSIIGLHQRALTPSKGFDSIKGLWLHQRPLTPSKGSIILQAPGDSDTQRGGALMRQVGRDGVHLRVYCRAPHTGPELRCTLFISSSSCTDNSVNFLPIRSRMPRYLETQRPRHTDSPLDSSASLEWRGTHFGGEALVVLLYMSAVISASSSAASCWAPSGPISVLRPRRELLRASSLHVRGRGRAEAHGVRPAGSPAK